MTHNGMNKMRLFSRATRVALAGTLLVCGACDFSVTNPGPIDDSDLETPTAMGALVNGMSGDLSAAIGDFLLQNALMADELKHSGNYAAENQFADGIIRPEDVNGRWSEMQRARWVAEHGIERMKDVLGSDGFEGSSLAPMAYVYAGFANRLLGENVCTGVIDGGPAESDSVYFQRADSEFTEAFRLAQQSGNDSLAATALAGRASMRAWLGDWDGAVADAEQVPVDFEFDALFSLNTSRENLDLAYETVTRREATVAGTQWADDYGDPRVPWDTVYTSGGSVQKGQDGQTPFFRQTKYTDLGSDVPLVKGTEMLLLRAEAALRDENVDDAMDLVNEERAHYGLGSVSAPTVDSAWTILKFERGAVVWLEGRRLWDLRRWYAEGRDNFLDGRDKCVPVSANEEGANPNL